MAGLDDKVIGKAEELKGKLTGDKAEELKGKARQAKGEAEDKVNHAVIHAEDALRSRPRADVVDEQRPRRDDAYRS